METAYDYVNQEWVTGERARTLLKEQREKDLFFLEKTDLWKQSGMTQEKRDASIKILKEAIA